MKPIIGYIRVDGENVVSSIKFYVEDNVIFKDIMGHYAEQYHDDGVIVFTLKDRLFAMPARRMLSFSIEQDSPS